MPTEHSFIDIYSFTLLRLSFLLCIVELRLSTLNKRISDLIWSDLLWCNTVGYPSDSLASCFNIIISPSGAERVEQNKSEKQAYSGSSVGLSREWQFCCVHIPLIFTATKANNATAPAWSDSDTMPRRLYILWPCHHCHVTTGAEPYLRQPDGYDSRKIIFIYFRFLYTITKTKHTKN